MFENLGTTLDHSVDTILRVLIKKAADKNAFIAEEAEKAIIACCAISNEVKVVNASVAMATNKQNCIKVKSIFALNLITD